MFKNLVLITTALIISTQANARGIDVKLANKMAEFTYLSQSSTFGYGGADVGFGMLFTETDDYQLNANVMVTGNPAGNNKAIQFGIGGKFVFLTLDTISEEMSAAAIAAQVRYVIPSSTPIAFVTGVAFAPSITSFSGADNYTEFYLEAELEVTPSARAYVGYRSIEYGIENGAEFKLDDGAHFGVKFDF